MLRYSALAFGVFYGFSHQRSITASQKAAAAQKDWAHKQQLIEQARSQYAESKNPKAQSSQKSPRTFLSFSASCHIESACSAIYAPHVHPMYKQ